MMLLDEKQLVAAGSLEKSMVVTAGAGSGKTRVLVERYIRLITREVPGGLAGPEKVVAITFTEKAASEMRSRVEGALRDRIRLAKSAENKVPLEAIMERLPQARISTIDSFCMNMVRKYPLYAGAHPEFSVLEPGDAESIRYESLKEALDSVIGTLSVDEKDELGESIINACSSPSRFIKIMEGRISSRYTTGVKESSASVKGICRHITSIRDKAIGIYEDRLSKIKALDFAIMEDKSVKLLSSEIGGEIRRSIDYVLVDEYQDINTIQDLLIRHLIAQPGTNMKAIINSGKLFIVGDVKQSIYRFRGAEPGIFEKWVEEARASDNYINLENNYRSNPVLIGFTNRLFGNMLGNMFEPSKAGRDAFKANGTSLVQVMASPKGNRSLLYEKTADKVLDMVHGQFSRSKEGTPLKLKFKDIALLSPSNSGIDPYAEAFTRRGIPVAINKSGAFYQSDVVAFIISFLATALNEADDIATYQLLASPAYCIRESSLASISIYTKSIASSLCESKIDLREHFFDNVEYEDFLRAKSAISKCRYIRNSYSTREILELLTEENCLERDILSGYGRRGVANFRKLIEISTNAALSLGNLADFLKHLETYRNRGIQIDEPNILDDDEDAVKLMTIHKAKGLEFPVVILGEGNVDMESRIDVEETAIVQMEDGVLCPKVKEDHPLYQQYASRVSELQRLSDEEKKRLLYVAATRAEELLFISGSEASKEAAKNGNGYLRKPNYFFKKLEEATLKEGPEDITWDADMNFPEREVSTAEQSNICNEKDAPFIDEMLARSNDRILRFSPSSIMSYLNCPKEYLRRHWFRLPESETPNEWGKANPEGKYKASDLGTIIHYIAQKVESREDLQKALSDMEGVFADKLEKSVQLRKKIELLSDNYCEFLQSSSLKGKVLKEVGFSLKIGGYYLEGIIDRLEEDGSGGWIITDLKTNNLESQKADELKMKYEIQLDSYRLALTRALGTDNVMARLLFLVNNTAVKQEKSPVEVIEDRLLSIMEKASSLPERCTDLEDACKGCKNADNCSRNTCFYDYDEADELVLNLSEEIQKSLN